MDAVLRVGTDLEDPSRDGIEDLGVRCIDFFERVGLSSQKVRCERGFT
jgi:hypothetical protein